MTIAARRRSRATRSLTALCWMAVIGMGAGLAGCAQKPPARVVASQGEWDREISAASQRFNVPPEWIRAVMQQESGGRTHWKGGQPITSHAGAMGLMQVMPATYEELRWRHGLGPDAYDPHDNIMAGTAYLREMYDMFGSPGFLAAYNAGPGRYMQHLETGDDLPRETQRYVEIIGPQVAGIYPDDDIGRDRLTQYATAEVARRTPVPATVTMQPIPDGSTTGREVLVAAAPAATAPVQAVPIRVGAARPAAVRMQPIASDGDDPVGALVETSVAALPEEAVAPSRPAVVRMQPIASDGDDPVGALVETSVAALPEEAVAARAPAAPAATAPVRTVAAPVRPVVPDTRPAATAETQEILVAMRGGAPARAAAPPAPVRSASPIPDVPARNSNGLPAGWYVPTAPTP
jgi:hypothetical protein